MSSSPLQNGLRSAAEISYLTALPVIFSAPKYAAKLMQLVEQRNIRAMFRRNLVKVDGSQRVATFQDLDSGALSNEPVCCFSSRVVSSVSEPSSFQFDFLHVTPAQSADKVLQPFADASGFADVDKATLQSKLFANVFALGDCCNAPTSKTAAAVSAQSLVVSKNMLSVLNGSAPSCSYDGYTSCPLLTSYQSVILAEFDYDLKPKETFFFDQGMERWSMFLLKRDIIPQIYWKMLVT